MDRSIALLLIGLFFGGGIGFVAAASNGVTLDGHDHGSHAGHQMSAASQGHAHDHGKPLSLPEGATAPTLDIALTADPASGWNLHIKTTNFRFSPERASLEHVAGEGHAHVYVNGVKIARHYGPWIHIATLPKGENTVMVSLNSNDHRTLAVGEKPLTSSVSVTVQ